jgi:hypothetical protein
MARLFKKVTSGLVLFLLAACASGSMMTRSDFDNIDLGTPVSEIVQRYGDPVTLTRCNDGSLSYEYNEKLHIGEEAVSENSYFFRIKNGTVVSKSYNQELPLEYDLIYEENPNEVIN